MFQRMKRRRKGASWWLAGVLMLCAPPLWAGEADVVKVEVSQHRDTYAFRVTIRHADTGWDHYADAFEVLAPDGTVLGTRTLLHPHVAEQPFVRSLSGVRIPEGIDKVTVRAHDSVHGLGGEEIQVDLPGR